MYKIILRLFLITLLSSGFSCKEKEVEIPPEILKKEVLIPVLADMQIAQASLIIFEYTDTAKSTLKEYQMAILAKQNISEELFTESMKFYTNHPGLLQDIYDEVVNELSKRQGELEKKDSMPAKSR